MAFSLCGQNGKPAYGVKHYILDTSSDIPNLTIADVPGSTAYVIETGKTYILNNNEQWVVMPSSSSNSGGTSSGGDEYIPISNAEIDSYFEEE